MRETDLSAPEIPLVKADEENVPVHLWVDWMLLGLAIVSIVVPVGGLPLNI